MGGKIGKLIDYTKTSLLARAFVGCFLATHVPIISVLAYVASGAPISGRATLLIVLTATLAGTALAFVIMRHLLSPIGDLAGRLRSYRIDGTVPQLQKIREDDVGQLTEEVRALIASLEDKMAQLRLQAFSDTLTGLGNRRWLMEATSLEIARALRDRRPLSVIAFDLDHFKRINDDFGHDAGDQVLMAVAETARRVLRPYDLVARLGGEEFCAFLPQTGIEHATQIAERLRAGIAALQIDGLRGRGVTASFGVYETAPATEQFKEMLRHADLRLYQAKNAGRNQVRSSEQPPA